MRTTHPNSLYTYKHTTQGPLRSCKESTRSPFSINAVHETRIHCSSRPSLLSQGVCS